MLRSVLPIASALALASLAGAQDWNRFRGPNGTGVIDAEELPSEFGPGENCLWRTKVPAGASSPVIAGSSIFVTGAEDTRLAVTCLDRRTGKVRWDRAIARRHVQDVYVDNGSASPSPATDGTNVYAFFPEMGLISYDAEGVERWRLPLDPFVSFYGMASSPIVAGDSVILVCDQQQGSYILSVDAATGVPRWREERPAIIESWTTPLLYPSPEKPEQIITFSSFTVAGHSVETGEQLWRMGGVGYAPVCSPSLVGNRLYVNVPYHAEQPLPDFDFLIDLDANDDGLLAATELPVKHAMRDHLGWADTDGDDLVSREEWEFARNGMNCKDFGLVAIDLTRAGEGRVREIWRHRKGLPHIASPLVYENRIYLFKDGGVLTTVDATTGREVGRARLDTGAGAAWASPVAADGKVYLTTNEGQVLVLAAADEWKVVAVNDLGEGIKATPALSDGMLVLRTESALYGFGTSPAGR